MSVIFVLITKATMLVSQCNVKVAVRNLSLNTSTATIFWLFNYFRESIWVIINVQFHFLLHICRTSWQYTPNYQSDHIFFTLSLKTSEVEQILQNSPRRYLSSWRLKANIWIFQIAFSQWLAPLTKNRFWSFLGQDFICRWEQYQLCQSSTFCKKYPTYPIFWTTKMQMLFLWLNILIY